MFLMTSKSLAKLDDPHRPQAEDDQRAKRRSHQEREREREPTRERQETDLRLLKILYDEDDHHRCEDQRRDEALPGPPGTAFRDGQFRDVLAVAVGCGPRLASLSGLFGLVSSHVQRTTDLVPIGQVCRRSR